MNNRAHPPPKATAPSLLQYIVALLQYNESQNVTKVKGFVTSERFCYHSDNAAVTSYLVVSEKDACCTSHNVSTEALT